MIEITTLTKQGGPLTKRISLTPDGMLHSDGSACIMSGGIARRCEFGNLTQFAAYISDIGSTDAIALGALRGDLPPIVQIVTKHKLDKLNGTAAPDVIARTGGHISYEPGRPALALFDIDTKGMPATVDARIKALGGFWPALETVLPDLVAAGRVVRRSTTTGITRADTGENLPGSNGQHIFVLVRDGADIERFLRTLHERCWLAGLGWKMVGAGGQLLERSIVDRMVGAPERLVFEGAPILEPPLAQDQSSRAPIVSEGLALDTIAACPPLTIVEEARIKELRAKEAQRLAPDSTKARDVFIGQQSKRLSERTGMAPADAGRVIAQQCRGILLPTVVLPFDDTELAGATVADVLADPVGFEGATLADPLEGIDYGACKAKIMRRADGTPWIHSFAHGRTVYELRYDAAAIGAAIAAAPDDQVASLYTKMMLTADANQDEAETLRNAVAERSGTGKRTLDNQLKQARKEQADQRAQEERERQTAERQDPRPQIEAPASDAPWLPQMEVLNDVLGACRDPEPPMRDIDGAVTAVRVRCVSTMHVLTATGSNDGDADESRLPAPEHPLLTRLCDVELAELIERHIEYVDKDGRAVHLGAPFVRHFLTRGDRVLPTVTAVATLPIVLANGSILSGAGLDRKRGIIFRVPSELQRLLPSPKRCTPDAVADAMRYLTDTWLCDVATDYAGKCVLIASAVTILERLMLAERPAFFITAGQRGGGKTTVLHMVAVAALGRRAAACGWSSSEGERRKALFSYLGEGVPFMVWDNLPRGAQVSCPSIEKALTAETYSDRVLGESTTRTVPAYAVQAFTGNNVAPRGDMASRSLMARLAVDRPDPENRVFRHADPIDWTERNRGNILRALYTILLGNPRLTEAKPAAAETRFKAWWHLVGSAIENAARLHRERAAALTIDSLKGCAPDAVSFRKLFLDSEADEEQTSSLATVLETLQRKWPSGFKAADAAFFAAGADENSIAFKGALEVATGKALPSISSVSVAWRLKSLADAPVNLGKSVAVLRYAADHHGGSFVVRAI